MKIDLEGVRESRLETLLTGEMFESNGLLYIAITKESFNCFSISEGLWESLHSSSPINKITEIKCS